MRVVLVGLSGIGKSYWSRKLAHQESYLHICCDDLIEQRLKGRIQSAGSGTAAVAEWMGQPYTEGYKDREREYLKLEQQVLEEALSLKAHQEAEHVVLDTTGSVIYLDPATVSQLSQFGTIVYLEVSEVHQSELFDLYLSDPKPLVWKESFNQLPTESEVQALKRCYPQLLKYRAQFYKELAQVTLGYDELRASGFEAQYFLSLVESRA